MRDKIRNLISGRETPFYFYDLQLLDSTIDQALQASVKYGYHIHYALKANVREEILARFVAKGIGADCVSGNEVKRALEAGFSPENIAFAGVGKTDKEIDLALDADIFSFNVESPEELEVIAERAVLKGKTARVALRVNPNVNANTHKYITTGLEENKFGIGLESLFEVINRAQELQGITLTGLHFHIGSQITDLESFRSLAVRVNDIQRSLWQRGLVLPHLNLGGGLGIDYYQPDEHPIPDFHSYFGLFHQFLELQPGQQVHFELGRSLVAQCGTLVSRVVFVKKGIRTQFAIIDAGMTELIRPALYQSYHKIETLNENSNFQDYDVVGPICESSDTFGKKIKLPELKRGDVVLIRSAGAYGEVMSSSYNLRDHHPPVFSA